MKLPEQLREIKKLIMFDTKELNCKERLLNTYMVNDDSVGIYMKYRHLEDIEAKYINIYNKKINAVNLYIYTYVSIYLFIHL